MSVGRLQDRSSLMVRVRDLGPSTVRQEKNQRGAIPLKEIAMKKVVLLAAAMLAVALINPNPASAQQTDAGTPSDGAVSPHGHAPGVGQRHRLRGACGRALLSAVGRSDPLLGE
jgi:hypothetical protein